MRTPSATAAALALTTSLLLPVPAGAATIDTTLFPQGASDTWTFSNGRSTVTLTRTWLSDPVAEAEPEFRQVGSGLSVSTYAGTFTGSKAFDVRMHDVVSILEDAAATDGGGIFSTDGGGIFSTDPGGIFSTDPGGIFSWDDGDWYPASDWFASTSVYPGSDWSDLFDWDDDQGSTCRTCGIRTLYLASRIGPVAFVAVDGSSWRLYSAIVSGVRYGR